MKKNGGLFLFLFLLAVPVLAGPPLKVIYSEGSTTTFKWTWPYHPVRVYNATQTKPYFYTGRALALSLEDVSKYRFYYPERTCRNDWGYYFPKGVKLCPHRPAIIFGPPQAYTEIIYQK
jgi:hypothetical protein